MCSVAHNLTPMMAGGQCKSFCQYGANVMYICMYQPDVTNPVAIKTAKLGYDQSFGGL